MRPRDITNLLLIGALSGDSFVLMRAAVPEFGALPLIEMRVAVAASFLLPILWLRDGLAALKTHVSMPTDDFGLLPDSTNARRCWPLPWRFSERAQKPEGGMFIWVTLPKHINSMASLDEAVAQDVAFMPGAPFYANAPESNTLRLSFVTVPPNLIRVGIARLGKLIAAKI